MYYNMLSKFEVMSLNGCMKQISSALSSEDWIKLKTYGNQLKDASEYVGAGYLNYACFYMMEACNQNDFTAVVKYYPLLVEAVI